MITTTSEDLKDLAAPLMRWLNDNKHPHHILVVTQDSVELYESQCRVVNKEFTKD